MTTLQCLKRELKRLADPTKVPLLKRFFKTGVGEYGEGDRFLGIKVPDLRKTIKPYQALSLTDLKSLLQSSFHEERMASLLILMSQYQKSKIIAEQKQRYSFYIRHVKHINNWDLVDVTSPHIVGHYLFDKDRDLLYQWAEHNNLWRRRIAIISTFYFIRQNDFATTFDIAEILLQDNEDLIHKAVGWMLREVGKRNLKLEENFLHLFYQSMPRTMLRYTIEKLPENKRQQYLRGLV